jgi:ketosteroid isomerase-like protein
LTTIRTIYAAFGRGDIATILSHLDEHVDWDYGAGDTPVTWLKHRRGRDGAAQFFASLQELSISKFSPKALLEGDGLVLALVDFDATVVATGKRIVEEDEVHIWYLNAAGKVTRFRHRVDTHQHVLAIRA